MSGLRLYDQRLGQHVDALYAVLVATDEFQFFPEMYEIFGDRGVVSFLDIFAGQTITVPPRDVLEARIRDVTMWVDYLQGGPSAIPGLAKENGMAEGQVLEKIEEIAEALRKVGVVAQCDSSAKSAEETSAP